MSDSRPRKSPEMQPASAGGPPRPPKKTARGLGDGPDEPHIDIPDPVALKELASALGQRPFRIVADVMDLARRLVLAGDTLDFETASKIAKKHGFQARRVG